MKTARTDKVISMIYQAVAVPPKDFMSNMLSSSCDTAAAALAVDADLVSCLSMRDMSDI